MTERNQGEGTPILNDSEGLEATDPLDSRITHITHQKVLSNWIFGEDRQHVPQAGSELLYPS